MYCHKQSQKTKYEREQAMLRRFSEQDQHVQPMIFEGRVRFASVWEGEWAMKRPSDLVIKGIDSLPTINSLLQVDLQTSKTHGPECTNDNEHFANNSCWHMHDSLHSHSHIYCVLSVLGANSGSSRSCFTYRSINQRH